MIFEQKLFSELVDSPITYGVVKPGPEDNEGVLFIRGGDIAGGNISIHNLRTISKGVSNQYRRTLLTGGELIVSLVGNPGQVAIVPDTLKGANIARQVGLVRLRKTVCKEYVKYYLLSPIGQAALFSQSIGSVQQVINLSDLRLVNIPLPPLPEQRAIADVLSALDDKIDLNRRMNQTLEQLAQALFKHYFIDNPDVENWKIGTLREIADNIRRVAQPADSSISTPYIGLEHMPQKSIALFQWGKAEEVTSNKFAFKKGEILFGKLRPYFHKVGIAPIDGICSTDILVIMSKISNYYGFVLGIVSSIEFIEAVNVASEGTKMPRTNWNYMSRYPITIPPEELAKKYNGVIQPMLNQIVLNIHESRTLAELRDALLPKLMNGEIKIKNYEQ